MHPFAPFARLRRIPGILSVAAGICLQCLSGCAPLVQSTRPIPVKEDDGVKAVEHMVQAIGYEHKLGPLTGFLHAKQGFVDTSFQFESVDAWIETPKDGNPLASAMIGVLNVQGRPDSGSDLKITVVSKQGYDAAAYANLLHGAVLQQIELDAGRRQPFTNPRKSAAGFCLRNTIVPAWGYHYAGSGNPLLAPAARAIAYSNYWMFDAYGAAMLAHGFLATDAAQRRESLGTGIALLVVNRALGYFGVVDVSAYNRIAPSPYNLAEIDF